MAKSKSSVYGGIWVGDLSSQLTLKSKKVGAIDIDYRVTKQQYTTLHPLNGIKGGRKTSCMAYQQKSLVFMPHTR